MHLAAQEGDSDVFNSLIAAGADVNAKTNDGDTLLHIATREGHLDIVEELIQKGVDINAKNNFGTTALYLAAFYMREDIAKKLIVAGADITAKTYKENNTVLHYAADRNLGEVVDLLISKGVNVNEKNINGVAAFHCAAFYGNNDIVNMLAKAGANINAKDKDGNTALYYAAQKGHPDVVETLIKKGVNVNEVATNNRTALTAATDKGNVEIMAKLINAGADIDIALNIADKNNHIDKIAQILVKDKKPADISKTIVNFIGESSGWIEDDEQAWKLIQQITNHIPKIKQVEVIKGVLKEIDNNNRRERLLSFLSPVERNIAAADLPSVNFLSSVNSVVGKLGEALNVLPNMY